MSTITKIIHISDIHIRHTRRDEYLIVLDRSIESIKKIFNNDILHNNTVIIITGDIFDRKEKTSAIEIFDFKAYAAKLLSFTEVIIIPGNHDISSRNYSYFDPIQLVADDLKNNGLYYYKKSGHYPYHNILFSVMSRADDVKPEELLNSLKTSMKRQYSIALIHELISQTRLLNEYVVSQDKVRIGADFVNSFDFVLAGDNHIFQDFGARNHGAYAGSLFQQNISEDMKKGYLIWDLLSGERELIPVINDYGFIKFKIKNNAFEELPNPLPRIIRKVVVEYIDCPGITQQSVIDYLNNNIYNNEILNPHSTKITNIKLIDKKKYFEFYNDNENDQDEATSAVMVNILEDECINDYLSRRGHTPSDIYRVLEIHHELMNDANYINVHRGRWSLLSLQWDNILCYGTGNQINFRGAPEHQIWGIIADNQSGKSAVIDVLLLLLYGYTRTSRIEDMIKRGATSGLIIGNVLVENIHYTLTMKLYSGNIDYTIEYLGNKIKGNFNNVIEPELKKLFGDIEDLVGISIVKQDIRQVNQDFVFKSAKNRIAMIQKYFKIDELTKLGAQNNEYITREIKDLARLLQVSNETGRVSQDLMTRITKAFNDYKNIIINNEKNINIYLRNKEEGENSIRICNSFLNEIEAKLLNLSARPQIDTHLVDKYANVIINPDNIKLPPAPKRTTMEINNEIIHFRALSKPLNFINELTLTADDTEENIKKKLFDIEKNIYNLITMPNKPAVDSKYKGTPVPKNPPPYTPQRSSDIINNDLIEASLMVIPRGDYNKELSRISDEIHQINNNLLNAHEIDDVDVRFARINSELAEIKSADEKLSLVISNKRAEIMAAFKKKQSLEDNLSKHNVALRILPYEENKHHTAAMHNFAQRMEISSITIETTPSLLTIDEYAAAHTQRTTQKYTFNPDCTACTFNRNKLFSIEKNYQKYKDNFENALQEFIQYNNEANRQLKEKEESINNIINNLREEISTINTIIDSASNEESITYDKIALNKQRLHELQQEHALCKSTMTIIEQRKKLVSLLSRRTELLAQENLYEKITKLTLEKQIAEDYEYYNQYTECRAYDDNLHILQQEKSILENKRDYIIQKHINHIISSLDEELKTAQNYEKAVEMLNYARQYALLQEYENYVRELHVRRSEIKNTLTDNIASLNTINNIIEKLIDDNKKYKKIIEDASVLQERKRIRDIYKLCADPKEGIPAEILQRCIGVIIKNTNITLKNAGSEFYIENDMPINGGKVINLELMLCSSTGRVPVESGSGYQNAMVSFALRIALIKYFPGIISDFLILDEALTNFDPENLINIMKLIKNIKNNFKFIFIISHLPELQDIIEIPLTINQTSRGSYINY